MKNQNEQTKVQRYSEENLKSTLEYWTPERMANAQSVAVPRMTNPEINKILPSNLTSTTLLIGEPYPATISSPPFYCGGRFFFVNNHGEDRYGSAQFVGTTQKIATAAHCVRNVETGEYYSNFLFAHGYKDIVGEIDYTPYAIEQILAPDEYIGTKLGEGAYDYAFGRVEGTSSNRLTLGINLTRAKGTPIISMGYPENYGESKIMYAVDGTVGDDLSQHAFMMEGNPMGDGASGGALMIDLILGGNVVKFVVIGVFSGLDTTGTIVSSPIFDQRTQELFDSV